MSQCVLKYTAADGEPHLNPKPAGGERLLWGRAPAPVHSERTDPHPPSHAAFCHQHAWFGGLARETTRRGILYKCMLSGAMMRFRL